MVHARRSSKVALVLAMLVVAGVPPVSSGSDDAVPVAVMPAHVARPAAGGVVLFTFDVHVALEDLRDFVVIAPPGFAFALANLTDVQAPAGFVLNAGETTDGRSYVEFTGVGADDGALLGGGAEATFHLPFALGTVTPPTEGVHVFEGSFATGAPGSSIVTPFTAPVRLDATPPTVLAFVRLDALGPDWSPVADVRVLHAVAEACPGWDGDCPLAVDLEVLDATDGSLAAGPIPLPPEGGTADVPPLDDGAYFLRLVARDGAGLVSEKTDAEGMLRLDRGEPVLDAPSIVSAATGNDGWHLAPATITLEADGGPSGVAWQDVTVDDGTVVAYAGPFVAAEGDRTYAWRVVDGAGNVAERTFGVRVDSVPPEGRVVSECDLAGNDGWCQGTLRLDVEASDTAGGSGLAPLACALDGAEVPCVGLEPGEGPERAFTVTVRDEAGNAPTAGDPTFDVKVDATPPALAVGAPVCVLAGNAGWCRGEVVFPEPTASDGASGVAAAGPSCSVGGVATPCDALRIAVSGRHTLVVEVEDVAGNRADLAVEVLLDADAPYLDPLGDLVVAATSAGGAAVAFDAPLGQDAVSGLAAPPACSADSGDVFAIGPTDVVCSVKDVAGNQAWSNFTVRVVDDGRPVIDAHDDVVVEAENATGAEVSYESPLARDVIDGEFAATCAPSSPARFPLGTTAVVCSATDAAGNDAEPVTFDVVVVDTTPPTLNVPADVRVEATGAEGAVGTFDAPVATDAVDDEVEVACVPASGSTFALGTTTVTCTATDAAGNVRQGTFEVTVEDTTPPTSDVALGTDLGHVAAVPTLVVPVEDEVSSVVGRALLRRSLDETPTVVAFAPPALELPETLEGGTWHVHVEAEDAAGNVWGPVHLVTFHLDLAVPAVTLTPPERLLRAEGPLRVEGTWTDAEGLASLTVRAGTHEPVVAAFDESGSFAVDLVLEAGAYTVTATATDLAGRTAEDAFAVVVDGAAPTIEGVGDVVVTGLRIDLPDVVVADEHGVASAAWRFPDGTTAPATATAHWFPRYGEHTVEFVAEDLVGNVGVATMIVNARSPSSSSGSSDSPARLALTVEEPSRLSPGEVGTFTAAASASGTVFRWDFGDGTVAEGAVIDHAFDTAGEHVVRVTAVAPDGRVATTARWVEVAPPPLAVRIDGPTALVEGETGRFVAVVEGTPADVAFAWDLGGGRTVAGPEASRAWDAPGSYTVLLTAASGSRALTIVHAVEVTAAPVAPPSTPVAEDVAADLPPTDVDADAPPGSDASTDASVDAIEDAGPDAPGPPSPVDADEEAVVPASEDGEVPDESVAPFAELGDARMPSIGAVGAALAGAAVALVLRRRR